MYEVTFKLYTIICREKYKSYMRNVQGGTGKSSVFREVILLLEKKSEYEHVSNSEWLPR